MSKKVTPIPIEKPSRKKLDHIGEMVNEPGVAVEVDPETARALGAFEETGLSVEDAVDSALDEVGIDE